MNNIINDDKIFSKVKYIFTDYSITEHYDNLFDSKNIIPKLINGHLLKEIDYLYGIIKVIKIDIINFLHKEYYNLEIIIKNNRQNKLKLNYDILFDMLEYVSPINYRYYINDKIHEKFGNYTMIECDRLDDDLSEEWSKEYIRYFYKSFKINKATKLYERLESIYKTLMSKYFEYYKLEKMDFIRDNYIDYLQNREKYDYPEWILNLSNVNYKYAIEFARNMNLNDKIIFLEFLTKFLEHPGNVKQIKTELKKIKLINKYGDTKKADIKEISQVKSSEIGKLIWKKDNEILKRLIKLLQEYDFIENLLDSDPESQGYLANFLDKEYNEISEAEPKKIKHLGRDTEICIIIGELARREYIANQGIWVNSLKIFQFKRIKTNNGLSHAYTTGKSKRFELFEKILRKAENK